MTKKHKPRSGSLAFYPRKRAKRETPVFKSFLEKSTKEVKPLNFYGYKVGMTHVIFTDPHKGSPTYNMNVAKAATVLETPPIFVFGVRAYQKNFDGLKAAADIFYENLPKELSRRVITLRKKNKVVGEKEAISDGERNGIKIIEKLLKEGVACEIRLLACLQPRLTSIGKKKPEVVEISLSGPVDEQLNYAISKLGKEISVREIFSENEFVDIKAVTKGKGFSGVVKRFGVKTHRPKSKKRKTVGSLGPITPGTVQWTVARAGQLGYQTRTEYNKRILKISDDKLMPKRGWKNYGEIKNEYVVIEGSVPGPSKRCVAMRQALRQLAENRFVYGVNYIAAKQ
ncbi:MAG: 50S ribosomal protein L3 [Candidatus Diapherotrites archaeon]|nr:50S ribosomal protein L3 [Candidatus Diapherotrites archaeon]